ncbi:methyl-accepting chemotaxis protein [Cellulomonas fimi]|uniref:Methyl-accepting chemotaxis sensory transducer with Cache sensor n=1 Tax=Cellulomonas fimi (strain ATCC 484 / DSM 20113 / JCM 1341 / CCUG 24087 / LMG 16345 / NBRC 15513 / NCIMB 8980 / NCTC 7547 / NRS-133) TaxID=590998 RepID=F4H3N2_CELFA|nr:methyl-accepting chemotaxis protein [Cellulomonas fimi]AEE47698.1 methyl-accepting chemotaxis sensory transducer with Cache sensor [Cellulomonas fimi ATCC 484]NNH07453.1 methyl-accepting chemotaxis protein [Cellulomonas fimi]VEH36820.1 Methyl-accepting chemotaxis protein 4 [Cellulomonas fimi]
MSRLAALGIRTRLLALALLTAAGLVALVAVAVGGIERRIVEERQNATRAVVQTALGVVERYGQLAQDGSMSQDAAQAAALDELRTLRYSGEEYFWVNDMHPTMLMHPIKPELDGTDLTQNTDPDGKHLFVEMVDVVEADGAGFVAYQWPKPGADAPQPKISYVAGYAPWGWVVGSGIYLDDVRAAAVSDARGVVGTGAVVLVLLVLVSLAVARSIVRPIGDATSALRSGDAHVRLGSGRGKELDGLAAALNDTLDRTASAAEQVTRAAVDVQDSVRALVGTSDVLTGAADDSSRLTSVVETSAGDVATSIDTVATGAHQMGASILEIARNASEAAAVAAEAVQIAARTSRTVAQLGESSAEIGSVVKVITSIAEQTNLLALNATIEAARAGEAGKGFSVVAGEVKELAAETSRATSDIGNRVDAIQSAVALATREIEQIHDVVGKINDFQTTIAGAVEEQTATTSAMASAVSEAAAGGRGIAENLRVVGEAQARAADGIGTLRTATQELEVTARRLHESAESLRA